VLINDPANFTYNMPAFSVSAINIRPGMGLKRNLIWNQAGGSWNTAVVGNRPWLTDEHNAFFLLGDQATFGDTGVGNVVIAAAGVSPDTIHVQNTTGNYIFSGGSISGTTKLEKTGAGTLTLANNNTYTGDTSILAGMLALDTQGQISPSSSIINNATLRIMTGDHTLGVITGTGNTEILSGSLTAVSIAQNTLSIGAVAKSSIATLSDGSLSGNPASIPEPATFVLLFTGLLCLGAGGFCARKRV
jgi:autotransporter-associated beta strand protein